jgi:hypothetical protein
LVRLQSLLRRSVVEEERLALDGIGAFLEPADETRDELRVGARVGVDDDHRRRWRLAGEQALDRPLQRAPLPAEVGLVPDEDIGSGLSRHLGRCVRAVVRDDDDLALVRRVRLRIQRSNAVRDRALLVVGRDEHYDMLRAHRPRLACPVEERGDRKDEEVQGRECEHRARGRIEGVNDGHSRLL